MTQPQTTERLLTVTAGASIRGAIRQEIEATAFTSGIDVTIVERKRLLQSLYLVTLRGDPDKLDRFETWLRAIVKANQ